MGNCRDCRHWHQDAFRSKSLFWYTRPVPSGDLFGAVAKLRAEAGS